MANEAKVQEAPKAAPPKDILLISLYPDWFTYLERPWTEEYSQDGLKKQIPHPGRALTFVKNKALVSPAELEELKKHRKYGLTFWTLSDLREQMKRPGPPSDPNLYRTRAKKLRAEFVRRRAWSENLGDDAIDFDDILAEAAGENPKAGRVQKVY